MDLIGSAVSKSFTVIGDTVNVASRLVGANETRNANFSEDTFRLAQQEVEARELDLITIVGRTRTYFGGDEELLPGEDELALEFETALRLIERGMRGCGTSSAVLKSGLQTGPRL